MVNNVAEYNLTITYNPNATTNKFVCYDNKSGSAVYSSNSTFPDLEELKYLKVVLGCALDGNGDPFRYSNINVKNFSLRKLTNVAIPEISCDGEEVTITCETVGASIYYKLNNGIFHLYSGPITISADTVVEAYAELNDEKSAEVVKTCVYAPVIVTTPIISCFNNRVTISCETSGASIFYRLNQAGTFNLYESYIVITANTTVEAYAALGVKESGIISELCVYEPVIIDTPVISCDGEEVTITCETIDVDIYYRLNQTGNYAIYSTPIAISADTIVEAYAELDGETSSVATETCVYDPSGHDYSKDYLTLRVISGGTIPWKSLGSGYAKTISYSINGGEWISITASSDTVINVSSGDVVRLKGTNNTYAGSKANYSGFEGGTATYDIEGNIMSLVYGDNFSGNTALTGTYNFCSMFKLSNAISAENLILPTTTLTNYCYRAMFSKATSLEVATALPATTLSQGCYCGMFEDCASLTTAPDLPATTLVTWCYGLMFDRCTNLNYIKCLATDISATSCTEYWVSGVASVGTFVKDSNTTWFRGENGIPLGWTVENYTPTHDYSQEYLTLNIISGGTIVWKSTNNNILKTISYSTDSGSTWTNIQSSTAGTSFNVNAGDTIMFKGDNTAYGSDYASYNTFSGSTAKFSAEGNIMSLVNSSGFTSATTLTSTNAFSSLFKDCTGLTTAEHLVLNATGLTNNCYESMFENCTNLTIAPELPATTLSNYCYENMFKGCSSLSTAPSTLPATSLTQYCYASMFEGCTSITTSPELPAPILEQGCYGSMFKYCSSLNYIKCLATDISGRYALDSWVNGVASSGTFVKNPNMSSWTTGDNGIPTGWTVQDAS